MEEIDSLDGFDAVVIGAPMILGWYRSARKFIRKHQQALAGIPVAYFCSAMTLTVPDGWQYKSLPVFVDPALAKPRTHRISIKENYTHSENYLKPILKAAPGVTPVSVAFFGGRLEYFRLKLLQVLFVMVIVGAQPVDLRNWSAIREWGAGLQTSYKK
jgi:menaquinone-dependent protoporphyrinogen IX oxidase